jgi:cysteine desulfurase
VRLPVYLDYAATTPVDPRVVQAMLPFLTERFGNAASRSHEYGRDAEAAVEAARAEVAALVNCAPKEIVWTSGATESINLALKGAARARKGGGGHIVTVATEHKATLDTVHALGREGCAATILGVPPDGIVDPAAVRGALRPDTVLVSVMAVNNEIGVIQDIAAIGEICRAHGVVFHVDAAQATGKSPLDLARLDVDLMSFTAHKTYGPKGIGALYVRAKPRLRLDAQIHGGGHERGLRSGTLPTHQIVGMGEAFRLARLETAAECARIRQWRDRLHAGISAIGATRVNGDLERRVPHNLNVSFDAVDGDALVAALDGLAVSSGSACMSAAREPSYVLRALGGSDEHADGAIRFTLGRFSTAEEIDYAVNLLQRRIGELRSGSPPRECRDGGAGQAKRLRTASRPQ